MLAVFFFETHNTCRLTKDEANKEPCRVVDAGCFGLNQQQALSIVDPAYPVAGGIYDAPVNMTGMLIYRIHDFGYFLARSHVGIGRTAPIKAQYRMGLYIAPELKERRGPMRPLRTCEQQRKLFRKRYTRKL